MPNKSHQYISIKVGYSSTVKGEIILHHFRNIFTNSIIETVLKVRWIEIVNPHVTVLSAGAVPLTIRVERDAIYRPKVTFDAPELLLEHQVEETRVELPDPRRRRRDVHGILPAAQHHVFQYRADRRGIDWAFRLVRLQQHEIVGVEQLRCVVLGRRYEHGSVLVHLHVVDQVFVLLHGVQLFSRLRMLFCSRVFRSYVNYANFCKV